MKTIPIVQNYRDYPLLAHITEHDICPQEIFVALAHLQTGVIDLPIEDRPTARRRFRPQHFLCAVIEGRLAAQEVVIQENVHGHNGAPAAGVGIETVAMHVKPLPWMILGEAEMVVEVERSL